jgi:hypothetical protein
VAGGYLDFLGQADYDTIISHLHRTESFDRRADPESLAQTQYNLKLFELMLRCGLIPNVSYSNLSKYCKKYLVSIRSQPVVEDPTRSPLSSSILTALQEIAFSVREEFIGPFRVIFCQMNEPVGIGRINPNPDLRTMAKRFTAVEVLYTDMTPEWKIRSAALSALNIKSVVVPESDWNILSNDPKAQQIYLMELLRHRR